MIKTVFSCLGYGAGEVIDSVPKGAFPLVHKFVLEKGCGVTLMILVRLVGKRSGKEFELCLVFQFTGELVGTFWWSKLVFHVHT